MNAKECVAKLKAACDGSDKAEIVRCTGELAACLPNQAVAQGHKPDDCPTPEECDDCLSAVHSQRSITMAPIAAGAAAAWLTPELVAMAVNFAIELLNYFRKQATS